MNKGILMIIVGVFLLGCLTSILLVDSRAEVQKPTIFTSQERMSPSDWIKENDVRVYDNKVVINIENPSWAKFTNTNSMDPLFDEDSHAIEITPTSSDQINEGDIIAYYSAEIDSVVIHRVVEKNYDEQGVYFIMKGDNNKRKDPEKVRFKDIRKVLVAIIY